MNTTDLIEDKVDELLFINTYEPCHDQEELLLVPDNFAEIIIPISRKQIQIRIIGTMKFVTMSHSGIYFLSPRRRGMEVRFEKGMQFVIIKVNPVYTKMISDRLEEVFTGIYDCGVSDEAYDRLRVAIEVEDVRSLSQWLKRELLEGEELMEINSTVEESILRIKDTSGAIKIKELYTNLNISKSKLEKHFNNELRMTPKEFCKIEKINHFIRSYYEGYSQNLTELTYKCGYYDQSHLIKDFKYFLDTSPKRYFAQSNY